MSNNQKEDKAVKEKEKTLARKENNSFYLPSVNQENHRKEMEII